MRRALPAIGLFFLAPLISEFLLGNLAITMLSSLIVLAPMYGGGAVLIREIVRRTGRGWASILVLALGYAILEEAFLTQTLFNPDYLGMNMQLLQPAYISVLGIGAWWTVFVLTLHTVWSIPVSIGLMEALVPDRATTPWLGRVGLSVNTVLFVLGAIAVARFSVTQDRNHFMASAAQFASSAVVLLIVVIVGLRLPRSSSVRVPGSVPNPWFVGAGALAAASIFLIVPNRFGWWTVAIYVALDLVVIAAVVTWSRRDGWDGRHRLALAGGAALAYAWHAFVQHPVAGKAGMINRVGNVVFALGLVLLLAIAARRTASAHRGSAQ